LPAEGRFALLSLATGQACPRLVPEGKLPHLGLAASQAPPWSAAEGKVTYLECTAGQAYTRRPLKTKAAYTASPPAKRARGWPLKKVRSKAKMSGFIDDFTAGDDDSSKSFDKLEFMRKRMHEIGAKLYEESKMLAKAQAKISALEDELGIWKSKAKKRQRALVKMQMTGVDI
jgi:hypothetical protein